MDNRRYAFEFGGGEITELTANVIAESMYAQVYLDGNDALLMDSMVDYNRNEHALTIQDQNVVVKGRPSLRQSNGI